MQKFPQKLNSVLATLLLSLATRADAETEPRLTIERVAPGVFAFLPTDEALESWTAVSNSAAVVLDDGVLIYDSHWTPPNVEEARGLLRQHTDKPIRYVVQSHFHADHTGGAWAYDPDVEIITHHATRQRLEGYFAELPEELPSRVAGLAEQLENASEPALREQLEGVLSVSRDLLSRLEAGDPTPLPTLTFERRVVIRRGTPVEVYFLGRGHTDGDAIVFLPELKVAFLGDLLWTGGLANVSDGYTREWITTLEAILDLGATRFVPGHGSLATADDVRNQMAYLEWLRGAVEPFVRGGKSLDEAKAEITLPKKYADYKFGWHLPAGIEKVFGELKAE